LTIHLLFAWTLATRALLMSVWYFSIIRFGFSALRAEKPKQKEVEYRCYYTICAFADPLA
jgi:hypothetical protein